MTNEGMFNLTSLCDETDEARCAECPEIAELSVSQCLVISSFLL